MFDLSKKAAALSAYPEHIVSRAAKVDGLADAIVSSTARKIGIGKETEIYGGTRATTKLEKKPKIETKPRTTRKKKGGQEITTTGYDDGVVTVTGETNLIPQNDTEEINNQQLPNNLLQPNNLQPNNLQPNNLLSMIDDKHVQMLMMADQNLLGQTVVAPKKQTKKVMAGIQANLSKLAEAEKFRKAVSLHKSAVRSETSGDGNGSGSIIENKIEMARKRKVYSPTEIESQLAGYTLIPKEFYNTLKAGAHVRYFKKNGEYKSHGFVAVHWEKEGKKCLSFNYTPYAFAANRLPGVKVYFWIEYYDDIDRMYRKVDNSFVPELSMIRNEFLNVFEKINVIKQENEEMKKELSMMRELMRRMNTNIVSVSKQITGNQPQQPNNPHHQQPTYQPHHQQLLQQPIPIPRPLPPAGTDKKQSSLGKIINILT